MKITGMIRGLAHQYQEPLQYFIKINDNRQEINSWLDAKVKIEYEGHIQCIYCGRVIKKTFNHGSCFPCFQKLPENDLCIVKPDLCHYDKGTCRDSEFGDSHCMQPHFVYLAVSSDLKVGLTRECNHLKRWGDQGAVQAIPIAKLPTRKLAGELEMRLAERFPDKTNWRKMLKGDTPEIDLLQFRKEAYSMVQEEYGDYFLHEESLTSLRYPIRQEMEKVTTFNLDKQPVIEDVLIGIKGQYLMFSSGVLNVKKYAGYHVTITLLDTM
ncbi:hypothetical protein BHU72_04505 [Desulfuribacillus stibiiarsenatis]|uniref:DUF2797 domain-containing protein n=1 Tax=Desulfuribacillus stibiiarsenatis TaxID=1390249 RepID=A0A1E5L5V7_9FIRM|nr:DUF2797 domain-containing protein [Desulfuribacillus stibiiarsenatis]OEH85359.1 hypothetical protein BHU72_04505 [Desulfuribacillus stibiiarsenatis]